MTTFLENLRKQAEKVIEAREPIQAKAIESDKPISIDPIANYTIERVINKNEIRLYFKQGWLSDHIDIWNRLKDSQAEFSMIAKCWIMPDNYDNQLFCDQYLGADFLDVKEEPTIEVPPVLTAFDIYKQQCNELVAHLGCEIADLGLLAIDAFHKQVFGRN